MSKVKAPKKPTAAEIAALATPERIDAASKSGVIARLVRLSKAFMRASYAGSYNIELPILCPVTIEGYGIRQKNIPSGNHLLADRITIGKKGGLIFHFKPRGVITCDRGAIIHVEMAWGDVDSVLGDLVERLSDYLGADVQATSFVSELEDDIRRAVKSNHSMHTILSGGFDAAQIADQKDAQENQLQNTPGFGSF